MTASGSSELLVTRDGPVVTLTLNRPERRNALTRSLIAALDSALVSVSADATAGCVVLSGAGGAFCSGVDLVDATAATEGPPFPVLLTGVTSTIRSLDLPVLAAVEGPAYGAGLALALASDIRIVSDDARLCEAYVRIGRFAGGGDTYWLPQVVGTGQALRMLWTGDVVSGGDAVAIGLAEQGVPAGGTLAAAQELARAIAAQPRAVIARTKHAVYRMRELSMPDALELSVSLSAQGNEADVPTGSRALGRDEADQ
ncbi:MAG TPA: enoyl-CoA hydratase/isomerase family protein [Acidimicrobiales bacterium]|jgi:enoyl-CoA hydratase/carnithine racemase|nr:enoyl-CoA hydratase/isomerase family protein [Acidimicrobiales bacterium]